MSNRGNSAFKSSGISKNPIILSVEPKKKENKTVSFGNTSVPGTSINTSTDLVAERRKVFPGARSLFLDPNDVHNDDVHGDPAELYLTEEDKRGLTEKQGFVKNWLDPNSFNNLLKLANENNPNKGEYSKDSRINIVKLLNRKKVKDVLSREDIEQNKAYEYEVRICNIGKACVSYIVAGAVLARQLGILGGKGTRRSITKGTRRVNNRKYGKTRKNKSRKYIKK
jgi:hypothetical protein